MLNYIQIYCYQECIADTEILVVRLSRACVAAQFKSVSFLLRHIHFYLLLYFYHWTPATLSAVIVIRCSGFSSVLVADYVFRPCSRDKRKNSSMVFSMMQINWQIKFQTKLLKSSIIK